MCIFIGSPGAGKGSLSQLCVARLGWKQLSTGDLCRKHILDQTETGKQIDFAIKSGKLIADSLVTNMVCEWLESIALTENEVVIFDGYPRTVHQAQLFDNVIRKRLKEVDLCVVRFMISDLQVIARLAGRLVCQNKECQRVYSLVDVTLNARLSMTCDVCQGTLVRRADDEANAVCERLRLYHEHESALVDYYVQGNRRLVELDAEMPLLQMFEQFKKFMNVVGNI